MECRICGKNVFSFLLKPQNYNFNVYICNSCGIVVRLPIPPKDEIEKLYDEGYYTGKNPYFYLDERNIKGSHLVWEKRVNKLVEIYKKENNATPKNILDIGCSFGGLLETAKNKFGLEPYGVEISKYSSEYARERGINVIQGNIEEIQIESEKFDIVTMVEVIEHLTNPLETMRKIYKATTWGGIVLVQTANIEALQSKLWGNKYHYYLPGHLHYFSNKTLRHLLYSSGFTKVYEFYPVEFGLLAKVVKTYLNTNGITRIFKLLKTTIYHILSKVRIKDFALTSSMVMVGVKKKPI